MYIYKSFVMFFLYPHIPFVCTSTDGCWRAKKTNLSVQDNRQQKVYWCTKIKNENWSQNTNSLAQTFFSFYEFIVDFFFFVQARINRFEVGTPTRSLAGIVAYNSEFSSIVGMICAYVYMNICVCVRAYNFDLSSILDEISVHIYPIISYMYVCAYVCLCL